jgi:hypothetical protein
MKRVVAFAETPYVKKIEASEIKTDSSLDNEPTQLEALEIGTIAVIFEEPIEVIPINNSNDNSDTNQNNNYIFSLNYSEYSIWARLIGILLILIVIILLFGSKKSGHHEHNHHHRNDQNKHLYYVFLN